MPQSFFLEQFVATHYERRKFEGRYLSFSNIKIRQEPLEVALLRATCGQYSMSGREQGYVNSSIYKWSRSRVSYSKYQKYMLVIYRIQI